MAVNILKHSTGSFKSSEHLDQTIFSSGFLASGYFVNTSIINNGQIIAELTSILTSDSSEKL